MAIFMKLKLQDAKQHCISNASLEEMHREVTLWEEPCTKTLQLHLQNHQTLESMAMGTAWEAEENSTILLVIVLWTFTWAFFYLGKGTEETDAPLKNTSLQLIRFILSLDSGLSQPIFCTSLLLIGNGNRKQALGGDEAFTGFSGCSEELGKGCQSFSKVRSNDTMMF